MLENACEAAAGMASAATDNAAASLADAAASSAAHSATAAVASAQGDFAAYNASSAVSSASSTDAAVYAVPDFPGYSGYSAANFEANECQYQSFSRWGPLWPNAAQPDGLARAWEDLKTQWASDLADWSFWIEWYERILEGNPMDWDLVYRIATEIGDAEWQAGQVVVELRIAQIRAAYHAQKLADEVAQEVYWAQPGSPGIGHNNPPSIIDDDLVAQPPETIIWVAANELRTQAEAPEPDKSRVQKAVAALIAVLSAVGKWTWEKVNEVVDGAAGAFGKAFGAAGGVAGVAYLTSNQDKLIELANAGLKWLQLLP